jgi:serine/threonine-protein kinase
MAYTGAAAISVMAVSLGGLTSPYVHGLSIITLVLAVVVPAPWWLSIRWLAPAALLYLVVMGIVALGSEALRATWWSRDSLALFGANYIFVLASTGIAIIGAHRVWAARRQVYEARRLGRYRLKVRIGEGSMNEVWLAWDDTLHRNVALKILRVSEGSDRRSLDRFIREARALSQLASPHTVRVFDFGASDDGLYYIAMEYLAGADLQQVVQSSGPLPPARAVHLARQACRSLLEAHATGIIHRDVKPANLFVTLVGDERDFLKVVDFGIARLLDPVPEAGHSMSVAGTPAYMAPEVWVGERADERSDVYSLGAVLYFMLAGVPPFQGATLADLARAHRDADPVRPSQARHEPLPEALEDLVSRCLQKQPELRFTTAAVLLAALDELHIPPWTAEDANRAWVQHPAATGGAGGEPQATLPGRALPPLRPAP